MSETMTLLDKGVLRNRQTREGAGLLKNLTHRCGQSFYIPEYSARYYALKQYSVILTAPLHGINQKILTKKGFFFQNFS